MCLIYLIRCFLLLTDLLAMQAEKHMSVVSAKARAAQVDRICRALWARGGAGACLLARI